MQLKSEEAIEIRVDLRTKSMSVTEELSRFRAEDTLWFLKGHCCGAEQWGVTLNIPCLRCFCLPKHSPTSLPHRELDLAPTAQPSSWGVPQGLLPQQGEVWGAGSWSVEKKQGRKLFLSCGKCCYFHKIFFNDERQPSHCWRKNWPDFPQKSVWGPRSVLGSSVFSKLHRADPPAQLPPLLLDSLYLKATPAGTKQRDKVLHPCLRPG